MAGKGKRYIERCLWEYRENTAMLERLCWLLSIARSVRGHSYEAHTAGNVSDPVADVVNRIMNLEKRIFKTLERVKPVDKLRQDIADGAHQDKYLRDILKLRYFEHAAIEAVIDTLHISSSTYKRVRQKLLKIAGKYFGIELAETEDF